MKINYSVILINNNNNHRPVDVFVRLLGDDAQDADQVYEHQRDHVGREVRIIEVRVPLRDAHDSRDQFEDDDQREQNDRVRVR